VDTSDWTPVRRSYDGTAGMFWPLSTGGVQLQHHVTLVVLDEK
jgi:hypothetical protein